MLILINQLSIIGTAGESYNAILLSRFRDACNAEVTQLFTDRLAKTLTCNIPYVGASKTVRQRFRSKKDYANCSD